MKYKLQFLEAIPYIPPSFPQDHLSPKQHLSPCLSLTPYFRGQSMDVIPHPRLLAQQVGFHLLCHFHQPQGLLSEYLPGHNRRVDASISPGLETHLPVEGLLCGLW